MSMQSRLTADGKIACKVRSFAQPHAFGPHPPGSIVYMDPEELKVPSIRAALITVEDDDRIQREAAERTKAAAEDKIAAIERERGQVIASQNAAREAEERRLASTRPGPVTAPSSAPGRGGGGGKKSPRRVVSRARRRRAVIKRMEKEAGDRRRTGKPHPGDRCRAVHASFVCTRPPKHGGRHAATMRVDFSLVSPPHEWKD